MRKTTNIGFMLIALVSLMFTACTPEEELEVKLTSLFFTQPVTATGIVDETAKTVTVNVPYGTDLSNVVGTITVTEGATVTPNIASGVDFSDLSVDFTVTNGEVSETYTVLVVVGENPLKIVLLGEAATVNELAYEEQKVAYQWALDTYSEKAMYISFSDLPDADLETVTVMWWHHTVFPRPEPWALPAIATGNALVNITNFYKDGGNLLLTSLASSYLVELGRLTAEFGPTNLDIPGDEYITNPDNWGLSYTDVADEDDYPDGNDTHYLFEGLNTSEVTFEGHTYDAIFLSDGGAKKNRAHLWDFNRFFPELPDGATDPNARKSAWEEATDALVRASFEWDPSLNGVELGAVVEFLPSGDYTGTSIVITAGAYEWNMEDGRTNEWQSNIEGITENALDGLMESK